MDQRVPGGQKRARADAPQNEGDWTCPQCGNMNFAFRTNCNVQSCNAPKPSYSAPQQVAAPAIPPGYEQMTTPQIYIDVAGAPPPQQMSLGMPTPYGVPIGLPTGLPFDFNSSINITPSYGGISIQASYGPPGVHVGGGMGYGTGPGIGLYGMNYEMNQGPLLPEPAPGLYMEENGSRKRRGEMSEGDWRCPRCGNTNFAFRTICNIRTCNTPKPAAAQGLRGQGRSFASGGGVPDGSWTCGLCGNVNYSFRTKCNRRNCGAPKPWDARQQTS